MIKKQYALQIIVFFVNHENDLMYERIKIDSLLYR